MKHIEVKVFGELPCHGQVVASVVGAADPSLRRVPSLPILPILGRSAQQQEWRCERCGQRWSREPRPEEAL